MLEKISSAVQNYLSICTGRYIRNSRVPRYILAMQGFEERAYENMQFGFTIF